LAEVVLIDMPSCTGVVHAGSSLSVPASSTMHTRHTPVALSPLRKQSVGRRYERITRLCVIRGTADSSRWAWLRRLFARGSLRSLFHTGTK
jgi:hypothetical protein